MEVQAQRDREEQAEKEKVNIIIYIFYRHSFKGFIVILLYIHILTEYLLIFAQFSIFCLITWFSFFLPFSDFLFIFLKFFLIFAATRSSYKRTRASATTASARTWGCWWKGSIREGTVRAWGMGTRAARGSTAWEGIITNTQSFVSLFIMYVFVCASSRGSTAWEGIIYTQSFQSLLISMCVYVRVCGYAH